MFLRTRDDDSVVEVLSLSQLFDPFAAALQGRLHAGEELQEPELFLKSSLLFSSGEPLPRCWLDPHYQQTEVPGLPRHRPVQSADTRPQRLEGHPPPLAQ